MEKTITERHMRNEVAVGLRLFGEILERQSLLIIESMEVPDRMAYDVTIVTLHVSPPRSAVSLELSEEFLSDLPGMPEYRKEVEAYAWILGERMKNISPKHFYCKSGVPLEIEIEWPLQIMYGESGAPRAASCVRVRVCDLRDRKVSVCWSVITAAQGWNYPANNACSAPQNLDQWIR